MAYTLISTVTVGAGGAASIDFTSISGSFTDLLLVYSLRDNRSSDPTSPLGFKINGVSTNRAWRHLESGAGGGANSGSGTNEWSAYSNGGTATANTFSSGQIYIPNYAGTANKAFNSDSVAETNATNNEIAIWANLWAQTSAITGLSLTCPLATAFAQYSTASLYGIK
jgi:hypothetical protein